MLATITADATGYLQLLPTHVARQTLLLPGLRFAQWRSPSALRTMSAKGAPLASLGICFGLSPTHQHPGEKFQIPTDTRTGSHSGSFDPAALAAGAPRATSEQTGGDFSGTLAG
jgi:hypothetical protein